MSITQFELMRLYHYDWQRGIFIRRSDGKIITDKNSRGYLRLTINRKRYYQHRMAFLYMTGEFPKEADHVTSFLNGNSWDNLRPATRQENSRNARVSRNSTSGFKGVSYDIRRGKYRAYIVVNGKQISLGYHNTKEAATEAYSKAAKKLFGDFAYCGTERSSRSDCP